MKKHLKQKILTSNDEMSLHTIPLLFLSEFQAERFYWNTLRSMISAEIYLNDEKISCELKPIRPYPNQMFVALTDRKTHLGVFLPISSTERQILRTEWLLKMSGNGFEDQSITHLQTIDFECAPITKNQTAVFSIPDTWCENGQGFGMGHSTHIGTDITVGNGRKRMFNTTLTKNGHHQTFIENIKIADSACTVSTLKLRSTR